MNRYSYPTFARPPIIKEGDRVIDMRGLHGRVGMEYMRGSEPDTILFMIHYDDGLSEVIRSLDLKHE